MRTVIGQAHLFDQPHHRRFQTNELVDNQGRPRFSQTAAQLRLIDADIDQPDRAGIGFPLRGQGGGGRSQLAVIVHRP